MIYNHTKYVSLELLIFNFLDIHFYCSNCERDVRMSAKIEIYYVNLQQKQEVMYQII